MKVAFTAMACVIASTFAGPMNQRSGSILGRRQIFTDPTCELSQAVTPGTPFSGLFPLANALGTVVGPVVEEAIGAENRERIDTLGGTLCINSQEEAPGERGICQEFLQAVRDLADASNPVDQAKKYNCLLNLLCVARAGSLDGTCQYLLAGADCVANRILQVNDLECQ